MKEHMRDIKKIATDGLEVLFYLTLMAVLLLCPLLAGCSEGDMSKKSEASAATRFTAHGDCARTKVIEIEGHKYIIYDGGYRRGGGIIHAESCSCKKGF